jgi:hypothetical protein
VLIPVVKEAVTNFLKHSLLFAAAIALAAAASSLMPWGAADSPAIR